MSGKRSFWLVPLLKGIPLKVIWPVYLKIKQEEQGFYRDIQNKIAEIMNLRAGQAPSPSFISPKHFKMHLCRAGCVTPEIHYQQVVPF